MGTTVMMSDWTYWRGATGWEGILQEVESWLKMDRWRTGAFRVEMPWISAATFYLEGCDQSGGSFVIHKELAQACNTIVYLSKQAPFGVPERLNNLIRVRVVGPGSDNPWEVCFRVTAVLK